jgi:DNA-directed RNA polymerase subunit RPC12/RpoP
MENYLYKCQYCGKEFKPNRRHKQKFCSNSCRVNSFNKNKVKDAVVKTIKGVETEKPLQIEKMSLAGFGNAAAGTLAVKLATNIFTSQESKSATKGDLKNLLASLKQRYHPIRGLPIRPDGSTAFYDMQTQTVVYQKKTINYGT